MIVSRLTVQSGLYSFMLHGVAVGLLILSIDFTAIPVIQPQADMDIINAVAVDNEQVEQELQRIRDIETEKQLREQELERKLQELEQTAARTEAKRKAEEKRLAQLEQQKAAQKRAREEEQRKLADLKKQQEDLEKKRKAEEAEQRQTEAERIRQAEIEKQRLEEERKHQQQEQLRQQQLAEEQRQQQEAQQQQDQQLLQSIIAQIYRRLVNNFNKSGLPAGLECVLSVRTIPGGDVVNVSINQSSGNDIFDRRAINAVQKASPLPLPADPATLDRLRLRQFTFRFRPEN